MSLVNNSANNFKDFLDAIKPYLNYQFYDLSGQGVEANNFSTDEKVIGTWIDGKPLYQKTVNCGALPNNTTKSVAHNISSIDKIVNIMGTGFFTDGTSIPLPLLYNSPYNDYNTKTTANKTEIIFLNNGDRSNVTAYVTLQYTKTTDSPVASGEKIVGQWIDGKPVYQKTVNYQNTFTISSTFNYEDIADVSALNIDTLVVLNGSFVNNIQKISIPYSDYRGNETQIFFNANITSNKLRIQGWRNAYSSELTDISITIQYTKSS